MEKYGNKRLMILVFLECNLFKNRLLTLYKALQDQVTSDKTSGVEKAKCAEVAANIAIDVLKLESEGIKAIRQISSEANNKNRIKDRQNALENLHYDPI